MVRAADPTFAAPLRAVDDVSHSERDGALGVCATKSVRRDDPYLEAHFPSLTIFPGVFLVESVRQAVAAALPRSPEAPPDVVAVRSARFLAPLLAGDTMTLEATVRRVDGHLLHVDARCRRSDGVTAATLSIDLEARDAGGA